MGAYLMSNVKTDCDQEDSWHGVLKISEKKASEIPYAEQFGGLLSIIYGLREFQEIMEERLKSKNLKHMKAQ